MVKFVDRYIWKLVILIGLVLLGVALYLFIRSLPPPLLYAY